MDGSVLPQSVVLPRVAAADKPRVVIQLDQLLQWTSQERALHESQNLFALLSQPWNADAVFWTLDFMDFLPDLHAHSKILLNTVIRWQGDPVVAVHIYVDGSSFELNRPNETGHLAGWAFIVIVECSSDHNDNFQFYCAACAPLVSGASSSRHCCDVGELH